jgi:FkbM family methyltransferase
VNIFVTVERDFIGLKMISFPKNGGVAVDVGFNDGLSSTSIHKYTQLPIVAFEPLEVRLNPLISFLLRGIRIHKFGLSDKNGITTLYTPIYKRFRFTPYSSLLASSAVMNLSRDLGVQPNRVQIIEQSIALDTLDTYGLKINFLKVDTEGSEFKVLQGAVKSISLHRPYILIEISDEENFALLTGLLGPLGYSCHTFQKRQFLAVTGWNFSQRNYWFLP